MNDIEQYDDTDIAIVGIACRFPGANSPEEYWTNLRDGVESISFYSEEALLAEGLSKSQLGNPNYVRAGAPLDKMEYFDPDFFGFSPKEAAILDPQHRHFYECAWEAFENSGHIPSRFDGAIGVFAGCGMGAYFAHNLLSNPELVESVGPFLLRHTGNDKDFLSTRVSYSFNLKGPSVNVQTACSTSLVATHLACQSLLSGETDMTLAGGSTIELPHRQGYLYKEGEILSPDGHCRSFDHRSKGTIFGSGTGVVVLRRIEDALNDRDNIYAVIKGSAINNDGNSKVGYLAPSVDGQAAAITEALAISGVEADEIDYVECHGTGTPVGDPIEISALTQAFRESTERNGFCRVGSVKSNIGHLDTAAGIASLIKTALLLKNKQVPPSLNYEAPNPTIDFTNSPFFVNAKLSPLQNKDKKHVAGVNSLGVGGTNAFAVLKEVEQPAADVSDNRESQLITLSAKSRSSLDEYSKKLAGFLKNQEGPLLEDVAFSLLQGREKFEHRKVLGCSSKSEAIKLLEGGDPQRVFTYTNDEEVADVAFMFPGGGAQYVNMARDLYDRESVFKARMDEGFEILLKQHDLDLKKIVFPDSAQVVQSELSLEPPSVQLPAIFLTEIALVDLWSSLGVTPTALVGHSMGENTAACVAGVMSFPDALGLVRLRGLLMDDVAPGGMLSVELNDSELKKHLFGDLGIASINSPLLAVATGSLDEITLLSENLDQLGIQNQRVKINIAAHSSMLDGILEPFKQYLNGISLQPPSIPIVSNLTGQWLQDKQAIDPNYWVDHLRNTVQFSKCVSTLLEKDTKVLLEVGPGNTLSSLAKHQENAKPQRIMASLRHPEMEVADDTFIITVLGKLWMCGFEIDASLLWKTKDRKRVPLPTYAFNHRKYWIDPGKPAAEKGQQIAQLEKIESFTEWFYEPVWVQQGVLPEQPLRKNTWLIFHDEIGYTTALQEHLVSTGHNVISVYEGDSFFQSSEKEYRLSPEQGAEGYNALVRNIISTGANVDRVLHAWLLTKEERFRPGSSFFHRNKENGFYSLFFLAKAFLAEQIEEQEMHWITLTNGMQQVEHELVLYPEKSTVIGPCKVIPREMPGVTCVTVDIDLGTDPASGRSSTSSESAMADQHKKLLSTELIAPPATATIAYRNGVRWEQRLKGASDAVSESVNSHLTEGGIYLITGGLGGIGVSMASYLSKKYDAKIALISRTPLPDRANWGKWLKTHGDEDAISRNIRKLQALESEGCEPLVLDADVTNVERMRSVVSEIHEKLGKINGIFHAAGAIRDSLISIKTQTEIEEVFSPKIYGTMVLAEVFKEHKLDFVLLYSSTSTLLAPIGQVDYVAANAFLNATVRSNTFSQSCRNVKAINWGVWNKVGMAAEAAQKMGLISAPDTSSVKPKETRNPLFDSRTAEVLDEKKTHYVTIYLSPESNWLLDEHRTNAGEALLPGTSYVELMLAALKECGETEKFEIRDLLFLKAFYVKDSSTTQGRIKLVQTATGYHCEVQSLVESKEGERGWCLHAEANLLASSSEQPATIHVEETLNFFAIKPTGSSNPSLKSDQESHLQFGPRWKVLKQVSIKAQQGLAELYLDDEFIDDLETIQVHPALLDLATGFAMALIDGYSAQSGETNLWIPVSYQRLNIHKPLTQHFWSKASIYEGSSTASGFARFDVTLFAQNGDVLLEVTELTIKQMDKEVSFAHEPLPSSKELELEAEAKGTGEVKQLSPAERAFQHNITQGILPEEGTRAAEQVISASAANVTYVSSLSLDELILEQEQLAAAATSSSTDSAKFSRPELENEFVEPTNEIERTLVSIWEELLGVDQVGIHDNFFDLGGHSLVAVRLFAKVRQRYDIDYPISILFQAPTIAACAEMLQGELGDEASANENALDNRGTGDDNLQTNRYKHLVPMHASVSATNPPFFLVAGMFGNVLNLRHLANLIGTDREFYGLQAKGLYGDQEPHTTFESMAKDYIAELRTVQPHGPYYLGGFSGGGITAFEIARQLREEGEEIALLVLLDTPLPTSPPLSSVDKISIHLQRIRAKGASYFAEWARNRYQWERHKLQQKFSKSDEAENPYDFQSDTIQVAFLEALDKYELLPQELTIHLFRPRLDEVYRLRGGRILNTDRNPVFHDNGWSPFVSNVEVHVVPGDHDSMVLEPNVRVLATELREIIESKSK